MNKLEIYGIALAVLLIALVGSYAKGHHAGYVAAEDKAAVELAHANERTDSLQAQLVAATRETETKLESVRSQHEAQLNAARSSVSDRLCKPAINPVKTPDSGSASGVVAPAGPSNAVPQPAQGTDEWRFAFVQACQHDSDALTGWQMWWATQAITSRIPSAASP